MKYIEFNISFSSGTSEDTEEIVIAELAELGFESFTQNGNIISAYINEKEYKSYRVDIFDYLNSIGYKYEQKNIADDRNWNAEWESNFAPIEIDERCRIRAPFHPAQEGIEHEIVIMPKMSFGTGHHATTYLMLKAILDGDFTGKRGLDMGSGTGVLAILALRCGALNVDAIDIDEWAYENCVENIAANGVSQSVKTLLGDASLLTKSDEYDFILANINRNILLMDMDKYVNSLRCGGYIYFSGFLSIDVKTIQQKAISLGLDPIGLETKDGWNLIICKKIQ